MNLVMYETVKAILAKCGIVTWQLENGFGLTSRAVHCFDHTSVTEVIANRLRHGMRQEAAWWDRRLEMSSTIISSCAIDLRLMIGYEGIDERVARKGR